jgi:hypothetical protein
MIKGVDASKVEEEARVSIRAHRAPITPALGNMQLKLS